MTRLPVFSVLISLLLCVPVVADDAAFAFGGDLFVGGNNATISSAVAGDAFLAGNAVSIGAPVGGDAHLMGMNLSINQRIEGNVYAAGFGVTVGAPVGADLMAMGNSVSVAPSGSVSGNARLAGADVVVNAPIGGSALISAASARLDAAVAGDMQFYGQSLAFGDGARVGGQLVIYAPEPIDVPASVAPASRVTFERTEAHEMPSPAEMDNQVKSAFLWGGVLLYVVLIVIGIVLITLLERATSGAYDVAIRRPWRSIVTGFVLGAALVGLVPVTAMTLLGIPLVPFVAILIGLIAAAGYVAGVLFLTMRIMANFTGVDTVGKRIVALVAGLVIVGILFMVPVLGWLLALALTFFGLGAFGFTMAAGWTAPKASKSAQMPA